MIIGINGYAGSGKDTVGKLIQIASCKDIPEGVDLEDLISQYHILHEWWIEEQSGWEIKKWAGKLKIIASMITGIPVENFEDQEFKKTFLGPEWNYWSISIIDNGRLLFQHGRFTTQKEAEDFIPFLKQNYGEFRMDYVVGMQQMSVRQFLQELGTDGLRNGLHPNVWVNALMADYKPIPSQKALDFVLSEGFTEDVITQASLMPKWIVTDTRFPNEAQAIKDAGGIVIRIDRPGYKPVNAHPSETGLDDWNFDHKIMNGSDLTSLLFTVGGILRKENLI